MRIFNRIFTRGMIVAFLLTWLAICTGAQTTRPVQHFTLTMRSEREPYGTSAYSFRLASQDFEAHQNYIDLLFGNCGLLHINPVSSMNGRITDLGEQALDAAPDVAAETARWHTRSIAPHEGHVYLQEIVEEDQRSIVKFRVDEVKENSLTISWVGLTIAPFPKPAPGDGKRGAAGPMGMCGGKHATE